MPIPTPRSGESQDQFISRCMETMADEFDDNEQRAAICYDAWRNKMGQEKLFKLRDLKIDGSTGTFKAVFATMNVVDHDGDLTLPGAFGRQKVLVSQYNHGSWGKGVEALPIGVGEIYEDGDDAVIEGEFNLDSQGGLETHKTLKYLDSKGMTQEFSYALPEIDYEFREMDGQEVRVLKRIKVQEVSPVIMGAGINTRLLGVKSRDLTDEEKSKLGELAKQYGVTFILAEAEEKKGTRLVDHLDVVTASLKDIVDRLSTVRELRDIKGTDLSEETTTRMVALETEVRKMADLLHDLSFTQRETLRKEVVRFIKTTQGG